MKISGTKNYKKVILNIDDVLEIINSNESILIIKKQDKTLVINQLHYKRLVEICEETKAIDIMEKYIKNKTT